MSKQNGYTPPQDKLVEGKMRQILNSLVPGRLDTPGMEDTPRRNAKFWTDWINRGPCPDLKQFPLEPDIGHLMAEISGPEDGVMIIQGPIPFTSVCEHHLLPFWGDVWVGYYPGQNCRNEDTVVGLSKITRLVNWVSRDFQTQESITKQIEQIFRVQVGPIGLGVVVQAEHMCMRMRGVCQPGVQTLTQVFSGSLDQLTLREDFFQKIRFGSISQNR